MFKELRRRIEQGANVDPCAPLIGTGRRALEQALREAHQDARNAENVTPDRPALSTYPPPSLPPGAG